MSKSEERREEIIFSVNLQSAIAVYVQIENQVKFAIASGRLKPDDNLPSVRDLSVVLGVNPNTVAKAYRDLEIMGLVWARRGVGYIVLEDGVAPCREATRSAASAHLREAVRECLACGLSMTQINTAVSDAAASGSSPYNEI